MADGILSVMDFLFGNPTSTTTSSIAAPSTGEQMLTSQLMTPYLPTADAAGNMVPAQYDLGNLLTNYVNTYGQATQDNLNRYQNGLSSVAPLNLQLPASMGGASVALAPNAWRDYYSGDSDTIANLLEKSAAVDQLPLSTGTNWLNTLFNARNGRQTSQTTVGSNNYAGSAATLLEGLLSPKGGTDTTPQTTPDGYTVGEWQGPVQEGQTYEEASGDSGNWLSDVGNWIGDLFS